MQISNTIDIKCARIVPINLQRILKIRLFLLFIKLFYFTYIVTYTLKTLEIVLELYVNHFVSITF